MVHILSTSGGYIGRPSRVRDVEAEALLPAVADGGNIKSRREDRPQLLREFPRERGEGRVEDADVAQVPMT